MTAFLVDTHALLWFLSGDRKLSPAARSLMETEQNIMLVSAASTWEIAIKMGLGKLSAPEALPQRLREAGFEPLDVKHEHAWRVRKLAETAHKDPFDRLLAAQALTEDLPIISSDARFDTYGVTRHW